MPRAGHGCVACATGGSDAAMYTRCTHCSTWFSLTTDQLRQGHGAVRCGSCLRSFDALVNLHEALLESLQMDNAKGFDADVEVGSTTPASDALDHPDEPVANEDPTAWVEEATEIEPLLTDDSIRADWQGVDGARGETRSTSPHHANPLPPQTEDPATSSSADDADTQETRSARSFSASDRTDLNRDVPPGDPSSPFTEPSGKPNPVDLGQVPPEFDASLQANEVATERQPLTATVDAPLDRERIGPQILREDIDRIGRARRGRRYRWIKATLALGLSVTLVAQYAWFLPGDLVKRFPAARPWTQAFCTQTGCTLPPLRQPSLIRLASRDVRVHPKYEGALLIAASLINDGAYAQPFPNVTFTLFNVNGQTIASREFQPPDYLEPNAVTTAVMRPQQPVQIVLELLAPEEAAVSFEFQFH